MSALQLAGAMLAGLSVALLGWQWLAGRRFPLHQRSSGDAAPGITLFKPLNGYEPALDECLRSWFHQNYRGPVQIIFAVAAPEDPICAEVRTLIAGHPGVDAQLVVVEPCAGANAKAAKLAAVQHLAKHEMWVVSDADVCAPPDLLENVAQQLGESGGGLVSCFYRLSNVETVAMRWEAVAVNADFWSQVLQSLSLKPMSFALGAVMAVHRPEIEALGGFSALQDYLADDYQLGQRIAQRGSRVGLCPVVVECRASPQGWRAVWRHQLRWARTIRVCQPLPYFFSLLSNATLWPLVWLLVQPAFWVAGVVGGIGLMRIAVGLDLMRRLERQAVRWSWWWLFPVKDLLQAGLWAGAFGGNTVWWRGEKLRLLRDGTIRREPARVRRSFS